MIAFALCDQVADDAAPEKRAALAADIVAQINREAALAGLKGAKIELVSLHPSSRAGFRQVLVTGGPGARPATVEDFAEARRRGM
ncbi:hypothetical protein [Oricola cellulosilytica]|uniref:Uncharacterized protein n=1 Tax=Oricola cellulosilytica TaxID=1429082 RepID=A0A4R0PEH1_9HYPH|nr:hypothetical protein [Oricola cellulosilytica]TCD15163.1 hypothetical protein E0D97_06335 [Oricola cellulosilytica]